MNKKNRIILIIIVLLAIVAAFLTAENKSTTFRNDVKAFAVKDTASITKVFLADKNNHTVLLEKNGPGQWTVNGTYKARNSGIRLLLETMKNLAAKYPVPNKAHNTVISQLAAQSTKVEVYQEVYRIDLFDKIKLFPHEKLTKTYYVGGATADNMGNFMLMEGSDVPFVVFLLGFRGFVAPRYSTFEKDWRDHQVFKTKLYNIREVIVETPEKPEESFKVINQDDVISLIALQSNQQVAGYDTLRLLNFLTAFNDIRYEALLEKMDTIKRDSIISSVPKDIVTLIDQQGDTTTVKTFFMANDRRFEDMEGNLYIYDVDRLYALVNNDRDFVLIQYYVFDKILRPLSYFNPVY
ncbi:MAG TPA: DUF4340 domain-containing protein [Bacteroidales bacterium]|nr:DUF4340 domain-containing protein [Bacteroidales bacterium]HRX97153.1 DUF4340 domain-containing protein [Bacteroidales bacterium]